MKIELGQQVATTVELLMAVARQVGQVLQIYTNKDTDRYLYRDNRYMIIVFIERIIIVLHSNYCNVSFWFAKCYPPYYKALCCPTVDYNHCPRPYKSLPEFHASPDSARSRSGVNIVPRCRACHYRHHRLCCHCHRLRPRYRCRHWSVDWSDRCI